MTNHTIRALAIAAILAFLALSIVLDVREHQAPDSVEESSQ